MGNAPGIIAAKIGNLNSALIRPKLLPLIELYLNPRNGRAGTVKKLSVNLSIENPFSEYC